MRVLVTGGTGVVGTATMTELVRRGHTVRLFSRHARDDARQWPDGVEVHEGSVTDPASLRGAAEGCAAVIHLTGIISEDPPESTFQAVNVEGTRNVVEEGQRAGVVRFVYVSSLGANRGTSAYHKSKLEGERIALAAPGTNTTVVRLANVYGPGDEVISLLLKMIRMLPIVPTIDGGEDEFQPIWVGDSAAALANCVERNDLNGVALDVAGPDRTSMNDLIRRVRDLTGRKPLTIPVPGSVAVLGARLASAVGVDIPIDTAQITMLEEGNVIPDDVPNGLAVLGVEPTPLDEGLEALADALPEQLPDEGFGTLRRKRVWGEIRGSRLTPEALFERFRTHFSEVTPWSMDVGVEPGTPTEVHEGSTLTMALPVRGNVQVRVEEMTPVKLTLVTLEGHPLAGAVRFLAEQRGELVRFEVQVYDRAADFPDWVMMRTVGGALQLATWRSIVSRMVQESGGECIEGVRHQIDTLDEQQSGHIEEWLEELVVARKREEASQGDAEQSAPRAH